MIINERPFTNECKHNDSRLITECTDEQQALVKKWIYNNFVPSKSICSQTSYNLKHRFEDDTGIYLTNNQFKDAMLIFGGYEPVNENRLNWEYRVRFKRGVNAETFGEWLEQYRHYLGTYDRTFNMHKMGQYIVKSKDFPICEDFEKMKDYVCECISNCKLPFATKYDLQTFEKLWNSYQRHKANLAGRKGGTLWTS